MHTICKGKRHIVNATELMPMLGSLLEKVKLKTSHGGGIRKGKHYNNIKTSHRNILEKDKRNIRIDKSIPLATSLLMVSIVCAASLCVNMTSNAASDSQPSAGSGVIAENLDGNYARVNSLACDGTSTGTAPFDTDDDAGNDSSKDNLIVRTWDTATYDVEYSLTAKDDSPYTYFKNARIGFRFILPFDDTNLVEFDTSVMGWMDTTPGYEAKQTKETIDGKQCQVLTAYRKLVPSTTTPTVIPGTGTVSVGISVGMMANGDKIPMKVEAFAEHNDTNEYVSVDMPELTVSADLRYNVAIGVDGSTYGNELYDFTTGNSSAPNNSYGTVEGNLHRFGIVLQLRNTNSAKGLKGIEIPTGTITFDLDVSSRITNDGEPITDIDDEFQPLIWDISANSGASTGSFGRAMTSVTQQHSLASNVPNANGGGLNACNKSGTWSASVDEDTQKVSFKIDGYALVKDIFPQTTSSGTDKTYTYKTKDGDVIAGCFSAGNITIIQPTYSLVDNEYVCTHYGASNSDITVYAQDTNLKATGISGRTLPNVDDNSNQIITTDDKAGQTRNARINGSFDDRLVYTWKGNLKNTDYFVEQGTDRKSYVYNYSTGTDSSIVGSTTSISALMGYGSVFQSLRNDPSFSISFLKFDATKMEIDDDYGIYTNSWRASDAPKATVTAATKLAYLAKPDGTVFGSNREQKDATLSDLIAYETLDALEADGKICVGVAARMPMAYFSQSVRIRMFRGGTSVPFNLISDPDNIGTTAIITGGSYCFRRSTLESICADFVGKSIDELADADWQKFESEYDFIDAETHKIPTSSETYPTVDGLIPDYRYELGSNFQEAIYDEHGLVQDKNYSYHVGDTLYIKGEDSRIHIGTSQTSNGEEKSIWDIDYSQRYADIVLSPSFGNEPNGLMTDLDITVTLPKNLHYLDGTSYLGGTYTEGTPNAGAVTNGTRLTPTVTENADGTTTLIFRIEDVASGTDVPPIRFSTSIGDAIDPNNDVANADQLQIDASINSTYDKSALTDTATQKTDSFVVIISKLKASALGITVNPLVDDVNGTYTFTNRISNSAATTAFGTYAINIMPNTSNGKSAYGGTYRITGMSMDGSHISDMSDIKVYFTNDTKYRAMNPTGIPIGDVTSSWAQGRIDPRTGIITVPAGYENATAWCVVDDQLESDEGMYVDVTIETDGNSGGDAYCCLWGDASNFVEASAFVVNRTISGVVWVDDGDGIRSDGETGRVSDIVVSLVDASGKVIELIGGTPATATTGADGSYKLENVPAGDVFVRFDANGKKYLSVPKDADDDDKVDSDAMTTDASDGTFASGVTDVIVMPEAETLYVTHYAVENVDLGLTEMKPAISLTKEVDREELTGDDVVVGAKLTYSFTIENTGNVTLTNVELNDHLDGIEDVSIDWDASSDAATGDGALSAGETVSATATYSVTQDDIDAGKVVNTATVTGDAPDGSEVADDDDVTTTIEYAPSIEIIKDVDKTQLTGDDAVAGTVLRYTMIVVNTGNVTLHNVHITDELVHDSVTFDWNGSTVAETGEGVLASGEKVTATATYAVTQDDIDDAFVMNEATVHGTSPNDDDVSDTDDARTNIEHNPAITIVKDVDKAMLEGDEAVVGMTLSYSFTITNTGNVTLNDVKLSDNLNGIYDLAVNWSKSSDDATGDGVLSVGETVEASAKYDITQNDVDAAIVTNTADVSGKSPQDETVTDSDDAATTIEHSPSISLTKDVDKETLTGDAAVVGSTLTYDFVITNDGNVTLHDVELIDRLAGVYDLTIDWTKSSDADTDDGVLNVGETVKASAKYDITQSDIDAGKVTNVADVSGVSPQDEKVTDDDDAMTIIEQSPRILLDKSTPQTNISNSAAGRTVPFTFKITNTGNVTLHNVTLIDHLDSIYDVVIDWATSTDDTTDDGTLSVGESVSGTAKYDLTQADIDNGSVTNTATTEGTSPLDEKVSDDDDVIVHLDAPSDVKLTKTVDIESLTGDDAVAGKILTYTFDIENTGETTLKDVRLVEHLHGMQGQGIDWSTHTDAATDDGVLSPDEHVFGTMTYTLTQDDIDAGAINNTASVYAVSPHGAIYTSDDVAGTTAEAHPSLSLVKSASTSKVNGDDAVAGYEIEWFFELTNTGNVTLTDIDVDDYLDGTSDINYGNWNRVLVPGASHIVSATYKLTQADIDVGKVTNTAIAHSKSPDSTNVDSNESTVDVIIEQSGGLTIEKHVDRDMLRGNEAVAGATLTYTFDVVNAGNVTLHDVSIEDYLDGVSDITIDWNGSSDALTEADMLSPNEKVSATATYTVTQADIDSGSVLNTAIAHGIDVNDNPIDSNESSVLTEIEQHTELLLDKQVDKEHIEPANVGDMLTYTFVVTNKSNVTLTDLTMTDELDGMSGIVFDWDGSTDEATGENVLSPNESVTGTATYEITQSDIDAGKVVNTAMAHMIAAVSGNVDSNEDTVETTLIAPAKQQEHEQEITDIVTEAIDDVREVLTKTGAAAYIGIVLSAASVVVLILAIRSRRSSHKK